MRIWIEEYGRIIVSVLCGLCLCGILFSGFLVRWKEVGGVRDSTKTNFNSNEPKRTSPILHITDFKVEKGTEVDFIPYVSAMDFDGTDITGQIEISERDSGTPDEEMAVYKNMVTGWKGRVWDEQGVFRFELKVKSAVTGKVTRGKLVVLVDFLGNRERRDVP